MYTKQPLAHDSVNQFEQGSEFPWFKDLNGIQVVLWDNTIYHFAKMTSKT